MQNIINGNNTNHRENTMREKKNKDKLHNVIETAGKIKLAILKQQHKMQARITNPYDSHRNCMENITGNFKIAT